MRHVYSGDERVRATLLLSSDLRGEVSLDEEKMRK